MKKKCNKCGKLLKTHKTEIILLPMTNNGEDNVQKNKQVIVYYCEKCDNFRTDLKV